MTTRAHKIWEAFCGELTQPATDDMREALATALKEVINQLGYTHLYVDGDHGLGVVNIRDIMSIIEELEELK